MYFIVSMELEYKKHHQIYNNIMMTNTIYECIEKSIKFFTEVFVEDIISMDKIRKVTTDQNRYWKKDSNKIYYCVLIIPIDSFKDEKQLLSDYDKYIYLTDKKKQIISINDMISYTESYDLYEVYFDNYGNHVSRFIVPYQGNYDFDMAYQVDLDNKFSTFDKFLKGDVVIWSKEPTREYIIGPDMIKYIRSDKIDIPTIVDIYPIKELGKKSKNGLPIFISEVHISELTPVRRATDYERQTVEAIRV